MPSLRDYQKARASGSSLSEFLAIRATCLRRVLVLKCPLAKSTRYSNLQRQTECDDCSATDGHILRQRTHDNSVLSAVVMKWNHHYGFCS